MSLANQEQIGGDHYRQVDGEQHWDRLTRLYGIRQTWPYYAFNATAYLERHWLKHRLPNGEPDWDKIIEDVGKAEHYSRKLKELYMAERNKQQTNCQHDYEVVPDYAGGMVCSKCGKHEN